MPTVTVSVLGSTGSIGKNTLDVIKMNPGFEVYGLSAHSNIELLLDQCKEFQPRYAVVSDDNNAVRFGELLESSDCKTELLTENASLERIASDNDVQVVMTAIVGAAGLASTLAAVAAGKRVLLANKESLVMTGELFMDTAMQSGATIIPIDSEHSAIHQCLAGKKDTKDEVKRLVLTGSGGPFLDRNIKDFAYITPEEAVKHPVWSMGKKISVDSATMMNKGLEVIEAKWLFKLDPEKIEILIHPEGIVHYLVEFQDASVIAQMSVPDMKIPIAYGLGFPERIKSTSNSLRLEEIGQLNFSRPDLKKFPSIKIAREALISGGTASTLLNAANEEAVGAFLNKKISFIQIPEIISFVMDTIPIKTVKELGSILEADALGRESAINRMHQVNN